VNPNVYIIAGPNGTGKTTFAREFLPNYANCRVFINADLIAQGLSPFAPERLADRWILFDNSGVGPREVATSWHGKLRVVDERPYNELIASYGDASLAPR
jgi:predicted ABC-type ATPase